MIDIAENKTASVFRVGIENIADLWPKIVDLVVAGMVGQQTHSAEDVLHILLSNRATLWVQWSDRVEAMVITEFVSYPRGLALRVWLAGAPNEDRLNRELFKIELFRWARRNECRWVEVCGRVGWLRAFPDAQYSGILMRLDVDKDYTR